MRLIALIGLLVCSCAMAETATFAEDNWPPYTVFNPGQPPSGIGVDIVREAFDRIGVKTVFVEHPWKRVLQLAKGGHIDGVPVIKRNKEREQYLVFSAPYLEALQTFYYLKGRNIQWRTLDDLKHYRIGKQQSSDFGPQWRKAESYLNVYNVMREEQIVNMVLARRIDLMLTNSLVAESIIASNPRTAGKFARTDRALDIDHFYIGISKKSKYATQLNELNRALTAMKMDGFIAAVIERKR